MLASKRDIRCRQSGQTSRAIAHNKVIVVDGQMVITGSFNFTRAAEEDNAENLLQALSAGLHGLAAEAADFRRGDCSGRSVGPRFRIGSLPVRRASGPEFRRDQGHEAGGSVDRQTGGLPHTGTVTRRAGDKFPSCGVAAGLWLISAVTSSTCNLRRAEAVACANRAIACWPARPEG